MTNYSRWRKLFLVSSSKSEILCFSQELVEVLLLINLRSMILEGMYWDSKIKQPNSIHLVGQLSDMFPYFMSIGVSDTVIHSSVHNLPEKNDRCHSFIAH